MKPYLFPTRPLPAVGDAVPTSPQPLTPPSGIGFDPEFGVNFRGRSSIQLRRASMPGVPPKLAAAPLVTVDESGQAWIGDTPVAPYGGDPQSLIRSPSSAPSGEVPPFYNPALYGNAVTFGVVFAGAGETIALLRPNQTRISLLVQNLTVVGNVFYCFDRAADNVSCIALGAGANRLFDNVVPQGDLHLFSTGAGTVVVEYMNQDISNPQTGS